MITKHRYHCDPCRLGTDDTDVALYHTLVLGHRVEIVHPETQWRTEYACGCWYTPEESHCCERHAKEKAS